MSLSVCDRNFKVEGRLVRIARLDGEPFKFLDKPAIALEGLRHSHSRIDLFTFIERLPESGPEYAYPWEWDNLAVLRISSFDSWWAKQIGNKTRNMVRLGEKKGVIVREVPFDNVLVQGISEIYNETPVRQGRRFPHFGKDIAVVREEAETFMDTSVFIGAFLGDELIGFAKLTIDDTYTQAGVMHIVSLIRHRDKAPTNALIAQAVRSCADRNIPYLTYSSFAYGNKERDSLSDFKERSGFQKVDIPRYYVPLTPVGSIAYRFRLHHNRVVDYLPEPVIARLRQFRSAWYARKFPSGG